jgi:3-phenylpropionate/cinnamic acid dioxygenase small subunit
VRRYDDGTPRTKHVTTNLVIDTDESEGTATARSYYIVFQQLEGFPLQPIIAGRYHDAFARTDGEWRLIERVIFCDLVGDLSLHLTTDPFA